MSLHKKCWVKLAESWSSLLSSCNWKRKCVGNLFAGAAFIQRCSISQTLCSNCCIYWFKYFPKPLFILQQAAPPNPNEVLTLYSDLLGWKTHFVSGFFLHNWMSRPKGTGSAGRCSHIRLDTWQTTTDTLSDYSKLSMFSSVSAVSIGLKLCL